MEIRRAAEGIRWPREKLCKELRQSPEGADCLCRQYDGAEGYYLVGDDGHASAYYRDRSDAVAALKRAPAPPPAESAPPAETPTTLFPEVTP